MVLVEIGGEPFQIVLKEEVAEEGAGFVALHGDVPGQHHGQVKK